MKKTKLGQTLRKGLKQIIEIEKIKQGDVLVFEPVLKKIKYPLKTGELVIFLTPINQASGHCVVTTFKGKVITMLHITDFRFAKDNEI